MTTQTAWENLPDNGPGTATVARTRMNHVLDNDPFARMFSEQIRATMVECFLMAMKSNDFKKVEDAISVFNHKSVSDSAKRAVAFMPLGFVTDDFKKHIVTLVTFAVLPKPEFDEWHRPI